MGTNDLKKYIEANRESFEVYDYQPEGWDGIAQKLDGARQVSRRSVIIPIRYIWRAVAMIIVVLGAVCYMSWYNWKVQTQDMLMSTELQEAGDYYDQLIAVKVAKISKLDHRASDAAFQNMEVLDQAFSELKRDLEDQADNEEVVRAMIDNYKIKLEILEQIIQQLEGKKER